MENLGQRVFAASTWFLVAFVLTKLMALARLAILARLLTQDQFGLMAIVLLVVTSLWALSDAGIEAAVVQKQNANETWLHTAWHMNWLRGGLLTLLCLSIAYPASLFFHRPELTTLLLWAALIPLIHGFASLGYPLLQKSLDFKRRVWVDLSKEIVFTLVAVGLAFWWRADVMAMLFGLISGTVAWMCTSFLVHSYRPRMHFDIASARQIWGFGVHLLGAGILIFLMTNLDDAIVGRLLGMEQLGQYMMAFTLAGLVTSQVVELLGGVLFPALSSIQDDPARIRRVLSTTLRLVSGLLTPIVLVFLLVPELPVRLALGEGWLAIVPALMVLVAMGWMRGVGKVFGPAILALGRADKMHKMKWIEFALFAVLIVPFVLGWGIVGAAMTLLIVYTVSLLLHLRVTISLLGSIAPILVEGVQGVWPAVIAFFPALIVRILLPEGWPFHAVALIAFVMGWLLLFCYRELPFVMNVWRMRSV
ncbi:MAG: lipopolysaccharide biosynthesis protein [Mariprofundales bacterium]